MLNLILSTRVATVAYDGWLEHLYNFQQLAAGFLAILAALSAIIAVVVDHRIRANRDRRKSVAMASNFLSSLKYRIGRNIEDLEAIENTLQAVNDTDDQSRQLSLIRELKVFADPKELFQLEDRDFGLGASFSEMCFEFRDQLLELNQAVDRATRLRSPIFAVPATQAHPNQLKLDSLLGADRAVFMQELDVCLSEIEAQHSGCLELAQEIKRRIDRALELVSSDPIIEV